MNSQAEEIVGLVLAGGASRRMGCDKAKLQLGSMTLAERAVHLLHPLCSRVLLADRGRSAVTGVSELAEVVEDGPGAGPAAGILGGAARAPGASLLVLACDLPAVEASLLRRLLALAEGDREASWFVAREPQARQVDRLQADRLQPLCALYRPRVLTVLARQVAEGRYALRTLAEQADVRWRAVDAEAGELVNLNTPADLETFRSAGDESHICR